MRRSSEADTKIPNQKKCDLDNELYSFFQNLFIRPGRAMSKRPPAKYGGLKWLCVVGWVSGL
jgi:hypothetical protein